MLQGAGPGSLADLDLRAARARRRSETRRVRALRRSHTRRRARRLALAVGLVLAVALAAVAGPKSASTIRHTFAPTRAAVHCPVPATLRPAFAQASQATGVPLSLLAAVAHVESRFDPAAQSRAGAVGVLQLMPTTAAALHYDAHETTANVMAGALYLRQMLSRYGQTDLALAAYNAGPTAVDRLGAAPTAETAAYVERVQSLWRAYGTCA